MINYLIDWYELEKKERNQFFIHLMGKLLSL